MTAPQRRLLGHAENGHDIVERHVWTVETSFMTGKTKFGVPRSTLWACQSAGWIDGLEITQAGREALAAARRPRATVPPAGEP